MKIFLILLGSFILGYGFWYLLFWFFTNESNLFQWHWGLKILYVLVGASAAEGIAKGILNK